MGRLDGKVAVITGAAGGIGLATAIAFVEQGAKVALADKNKEGLADAAKRCRETGSEALEILGDLTDLEHLQTIINKTVEKFGSIDILVNNAGCASLASFEEMTVEIYEKVFKINVRTPIFLTQAALPYLTKTKGCIINVSSLAGQTPLVRLGAYAMSKAALDHFTRCLAAEYAPAGVRVNNVSPSGVSTRFLESVEASQEAKQQFGEMLLKCQVLGLIKPEQVAEAILFLASAEMLTGNILPVDAGFVVAQR